MLHLFIEAVNNIGMVGENQHLLYPIVSQSRAKETIFAAISTKYIVYTTRFSYIYVYVWCAH